MNMEQNNGGSFGPQTTGVPIISPMGEIMTPIPVVQQPKYEEIPMPFGKSDVLFSAFFLVCGYLFVWLVWPFSLGLGATLFTFAFLLTVLGYFKVRGIKVPRASLGYFALVILSSLNFSLIANSTLKFFNLIFLIGCTVYWVAVCSATRLENKAGSYFTSDIFRQLFSVPFNNFCCLPKIIKQYTAQNKKGKLVLSLIGGIAVAIPVLAVVVLLLMSADATFEQMMDDFLSQMWRHIANFLLRMPFTLFFGCYFFALLYANIQKRRLNGTTTERIDHAREQRRKMPLVSSITVLTLLCTVYVVFFFAQAHTLFSTFASGRPDGISYAEYARRGFFELCVVASINLAIMAACYLFTAKAEKNVIKFFYFIISLETMILIASALSKMFLYINQYGLTQLRVYTSWFMLLLFLIFLVLLISQVRKIQVTKTLLVTFTICFLLLCYSNVDSMIVKYNVERYQSGTLETLDIGDWYNMPEAAIPYAVDLYGTIQDPEQKEKLTLFLNNSKRVSNEDGFQSSNLQRTAADFKLNSWQERKKNNESSTDK